MQDPQNNNFLQNIPIVVESGTMRRHTLILAILTTISSIGAGLVELFFLFLFSSPFAAIAGGRDSLELSILGILFLINFFGFSFPLCFFLMRKYKLSRIVSYILLIISAISALLFIVSAFS